MWSLFNIHDSKTLTVFDLEKGVAAVTQSDEFFDCFPAVTAALNYAKVFSNKGIDEEEEERKMAEEQMKSEEEKENANEAAKAPRRKVEKTLEFGEFRMFLHSLRQYYIYCQVKFSPTNILYVS